MSCESEVTALLFPGQGVQGQEMLAGNLEKPFFRLWYPLVCDLLGEDPSVRGSNEKDWNRNKVASLLTVLVSAWHLAELRQAGVGFRCLAGYSVGQWTALYAAECLDLEALLSLIHFRAGLMDQSRASQGAMLAVIGLASEIVAAVCQEVSRDDDRVVISNDNCVGQLSLAGTVEAILRAETALTRLKPRKLVRVATSGAWHCFLLVDSLVAWSEYLAKIPLLPAKWPVIDNCTGDFLPDDEAGLRQQLVRHLVEPVAWRQGILTLVAQEITCFVECGYGNLLTKFGFFIDRQAKHLTVSQRLGG